MSSAFTDMLGQGGLWGGLMDFGRDFGSGWRDLAGKDSFLRNWWTGDLGDGKSSNVNLRNFAKFVGGSELGSAINDYTGGSWGGSAISGLRNIGNIGSSGFGGGAGGLGGMMGGGATMPPIDNSMILPPPAQLPQSDLPPGLLTMLLATAMQQQMRQSPSEQSPPISGGVI